MTSGFQERGRLANDVGMAVTGHIGEGTVDPQDDGMGIRNHHGFVRIESGSGDSPIFVRTFAIGDVMQDQMQQTVLRHSHDRVIEGGRGRHHDIDDGVVKTA